MKLRAYFLLIILAGLFVQSNGQISFEEQRLIQLQDKIFSEKSRIAALFPKASVSFYNTLDSAILYVNKQNISSSKKIVYQNRLLNYLTTITSEEKLNTGKYTMGLVFYKAMVDKCEKNVFKTFVEEHTAFTLQYVAVYADDSAALQQLQQVSHTNPDLVLKNFDGFANQQYAAAIIEELAVIAPEKVKNYFIGNPKIKNIIYNSTRPENIVLKNIYNAYGYKSKAYWNIAKIMGSEYSVRQADSIGKMQWRLYTDMVQTMATPKPIGIYSTNEELALIAVNHVRDYSFGITPQADIVLSKMNVDEIFTLLVLGTSDMVSKDFDFVFSKFIAREGRVNADLANNLNRESVSYFIKHCESLNKMSELANKLSGENHSLLLQALSENEENGQEEIPVLNSYNPNIISAVNTTDQQYKVTPPKNVNEPLPTTTSAVQSGQKQTETEQPEIVQVTMAKFNIEASEKNKLVLKKNVFKALQTIANWIDEKESREVMLYAADNEPEEVFKKYEKYKSKYFAAEVVERAAINSPVTVKRYIINPANSINFILRNSAHPAIKKMIEINESTSFFTKPYLLFDRIYENKITIERAMQIAENDELLLRELITIITSKDKIIGRHDIEHELTYLSLRYVRDINDLINQPDNIRFKKLNDYTVDELYCIMAYGRQEVLAGTFYGMFERFENNLPAQMSNTAANAYLYKSNIKLFLTLCANYNKLDAFLHHFSPEQQKKILNHFVADLEKDDRFSEPVLVAEAIISTSNQMVINTIQEAVKYSYLNFEKTDDYKGMVVYGILAGLIADKVSNDKAWFAMMQKKFNVADLSSFYPDALKVNDKIIERIYFYNDEDGRSSFNGFLKNYKSNTNWTIEDNFNYIKITSLSGNKIVMYANKPEFEESADAAIQKKLREKEEVVAFVVHRGHSFHTEHTLEKTNLNTKLLFVGSCGGFYKTYIATRNAPEVHVIASKQWASHTVNEPMLFQLNEKLRLNQTIVWRSFWDDMKARLAGNKLFDDYVPPHKNLESLFVKTYYKILDI